MLHHSHCCSRTLPLKRHLYTVVLLLCSNSSRCSISQQLRICCQEPTVVEYTIMSLSKYPLKNEAEVEEMMLIQKNIDFLWRSAVGGWGDYRVLAQHLVGGPSCKIATWRQRTACACACRPHERYLSATIPMYDRTQSASRHLWRCSKSAGGDGEFLTQ